MDSTTQAVPPVLFAGTVIIDTREQRPMAFAGLKSDARHGYRPLEIRTARGTLTSGDYSLEGFEKRIAVERKSLEDLFNTFGQGRARFYRELTRLAEYEFAAVVCEADWNTIITAPPQRSKLPPKNVFRSVISFQQQFPRVHWWMMPGRRLAEITTFRILERFLKFQLTKETDKTTTASESAPNGRP